ncbi:hypothetical protein HDV00_011020 [Rhizophlyctis rosea]|nr:hypothetical protein HDV00_011020 [Rhizophlyctis rosea]
MAGPHLRDDEREKRASEEVHTGGVSLDEAGDDVSRGGEGCGEDEAEEKGAGTELREVPKGMIMSSDDPVPMDTLQISTIPYHNDNRMDATSDRRYWSWSPERTLSPEVPAECKFGMKRKAEEDLEQGDGKRVRSDQQDSDRVSTSDVDERESPGPVVEEESRTYIGILIDGKYPEPGSALRAKAQKAADDRRVASAASQTAYAEGRYADANALSEKRISLFKDMESFNSKAAEAIFYHYNHRRSLDCVDLHGLCAGVRRTMVITGRGNHCAGGVSRLREAVEEWVKKEGIRMEPHPSNEGRIILMLDEPGVVESDEAASFSHERHEPMVPLTYLRWYPAHKNMSFTITCCDGSRQPFNLRRGDYVWNTAYQFVCLHAGRHQGRDPVVVAMDINTCVFRKLEEAARKKVIEGNGDQ